MVDSQPNPMNALTMHSTPEGPTGIVGVLNISCREQGFATEIGRALV